MSDKQQLVDEIRSFLRSVDQSLTEEVKRLASAYAAACLEVNQRLRRCAEFLHQGLRSEAIQLAQAEPVLLDQVAILDFPDRRAWEEAAFIHDLPRVPNLEIELAAALNRAYAEVMPLDSLLRQHRLLALGRAPIARRLETLRQIASVDTVNPIWNDDIREFEKVRLREIEKEARQAVNQEALDSLDPLLAEVQENSWLEEVPAALVRYLQTGIQRLEQRQLRARLERLETKLNEACAARDLAQGRVLRQHWEAACTATDLAREDPIRERVAPALGWLAREDRRQAQALRLRAAVADFENALKEPLGREELERRYQVLKKHAGEVPAALEAAYRAHLQKLQQAARRRQLRLIGAVTSAALVVIGGIAFWTVHARRASRVAGAVASVQRLLDDKELAQARAYHDNLLADDPGIAEHPDLAAIWQRLAAEEENERERVLSFQKALQKIEQAPLEEPDGTAVAEAERLARRPDEKTALQALQTKRKDQAWQAQRQREDAFLPRLRDLQEKVKRLESLLPDSFDSPMVRELIAGLGSPIAQLVADSKAVSEQSRGWAQSLADRFQALRDSVERLGKEVQAANRLTLALQRMSLDDYVNAMAAYVKEFPDTERGKDFQRALGEKDFWREVLEWDELLAPWASKPLDIAPAKAKEQAERCQSFLGRNSRFFAYQEVQEYVRCLEAISGQQESNQASAAAKLRDLFAGTVVRDLWVVKLDNGKTYYLKKDIAREIDNAKTGKGGGDYVNLKHLVDPVGKVKATIVKPGNIEKTCRAPQSVVADYVQQLPANFGDRSWDQATLAIAKKIQADPEMDPVLKVSLLKDVLRYAGKGNVPLGLALKDMQQQIEQAGLDLDVRWMDPNNESAPDVRSRARTFLKQLPALDLAAKASAEHKRKLALAFANTYLTPLGWLAKDKGKWRCRSAGRLAGKRDLCVVMPISELSVCQGIGTLTADRLTLDLAKPEALVEGRLVFARPGGTP